MQITCFVTDKLGFKISETPFQSSWVAPTVTLQHLASTILNHFNLTFSSPYAFADVKANVIERVRLITTPPTTSPNGVTSSTLCAPLAGSDHISSVIDGTDAPISSFLNPSDCTVGGEIRLIPYPALTNNEQTYAICHGEFYDFGNGKTRVVTKDRRIVRPPPCFISLPLSDTIGDAFHRLKQEYYNDRTPQTTVPWFLQEHNRQLLFYIQFILFYPDWELRLKDYFHHNSMKERQRPKTLFVHHEHLPFSLVEEFEELEGVFEPNARNAILKQELEIRDPFIPKFLIELFYMKFAPYNLNNERFAKICGYLASGSNLRKYLKQLCEMYDQDYDDWNVS